MDSSPVSSSRIIKPVPDSQELRPCHRNSQYCRIPHFLRNAFRDIIASYSIIGRDLGSLSVTIRCSFMIYYLNSLSMLTVCSSPWQARSTSLEFLINLGTGSCRIHQSESQNTHHARVIKL